MSMELLIVRMSYPFSSSCVAKECLKVGGVTSLLKPAKRDAVFTSFLRLLGSAWCLLTLLLRGSILRLAAGKTYCHIQSFFAPGFFRSYPGQI